MSSPTTSPSIADEARSAGTAPLLRVRTVTKRYAGNSDEAAVNAVSFDLAEGGLLALIGESGSGKSTLLRMLAGLEEPDAGSIELDGRVLSAPGAVVPPEHRNIGLVFQSHALFPHLTVEDNIAFGIRNAARTTRPDRAACDATVRGLLEVVGLAGFGKRYPHELSGGERQRVALARALAPNPRLLLLDEPFSSLDTGLRQSMRDETRAILRARGTTAVFVTHDTADALSIADSVAVLRKGTLLQIDAPERVYRAPATRDVARFLGPCVFIPRTALADPVRYAACRIGPPTGIAYAEGAVYAEHVEHDCLWIRPQDLRLAPLDEVGVHDMLTGTVRSCQYQGSHVEVMLRCQHAASPDGAFDVCVWHSAQPSAAEFHVAVGNSLAILPR